MSSSASKLPRPGDDKTTVVHVEYTPARLMSQIDACPDYHVFSLFCDSQSLYVPSPWVILGIPSQINPLSASGRHLIDATWSCPPKSPDMLKETVVTVDLTQPS